MGRRIQAIRDWHAHTYMSTIPVLSPRAAGAAFMASPRVVATQGFNKLFHRVEEDPADKADAQNLSSAVRSSDPYEEISLAVNDDMEIVLRNYNLGVLIGDLTPLEQIGLIMEGLQSTHFGDDLFPLYQPV